MKDLIFSFFHKKFGDTVITVKRVPIIHEYWIKVVVKEKNSEMERFANEIEEGFLEEFGRHVHIFVKKRRRFLGWRN